MPADKNHPWSGCGLLLDWPNDTDAIPAHLKQHRSFGSPEQAQAQLRLDRLVADATRRGQRRR